MRKTSTYLIKILLISILFIQVTASGVKNKYDDCIQGGLYQCSNTCSCAFPMTKAHVFGIELGLSILGFLASLIIIIGFISAKEMREAPGDIFFAFAVASSIVCGCWILENFLTLNDSIDLEAQSNTCRVTSYLDFIASYLVNLYNLSFFIFFYGLTRSSLKMSSIPRYIFHGFPFLGTILYITLVYTWPESVGATNIEDIDDLFGMSIYGQCTLKSSDSNTLSILLLLFYLLLPCLLNHATKKSLPQSKAVSKARYHFLRDYRKYMVATCVINVILNGIIIYVGYNLTNVSRAIDHMKNKKPLTTNEIILMVCRFLVPALRIARPGLLAIVRLIDPNLRPYWSRTILGKLLSCLCCCCRKKKNKRDLQVSLNGEIETEDLDGKKQMLSMTIRAVQKQLKNSPYLYQIQHAVRVQVLYSLLSSIHCFWSISNKAKNQDHIVQAGSSDNLKAAKQIEYVKIDDSKLKEELPQMMREIQQKNYKLIDGKLSVYAPSVFAELIEMDGDPENLPISLDLSANYNRILNAGHSKGGKSGEFFFFSYDENIVIKTISNKELNTLLEILPTYVQHFRDHPSSLIAKIYGVYTFERLEPYEKYNLILMRNVSGFPSKSVERKYDLKGSTYTRATVKTGNPQLHELKYFDQILKDLDFNRFEKNMHIQHNLREKVIRTLQADSDFLMRNGLIDYSLVLYLIDKEISNSYETSSVGTSAIHSLGKPTMFINSLGSEFDIPNSYAPTTNNMMLRFEISTSDFPNKAERSKTINMAGTVSVDPKIKSMATQLRSLKSVKEYETHLYYHIGIIDYLIKYTWKKRLEKWGRRLLAFNLKLDLSVQSPNYYASRFMNYMKKIIYEDYDE